MPRPLRIDEFLRVLQLAEEPIPTSNSELESYGLEVRRLARRIREAGDPWKGGDVWCRFHSKLVKSGIWAELLPVSRAVYIALTALADIHTRCTYSGIERVAKFAGYSRHHVRVAYRELKEAGLISRTRKRIGQHRPYVTFLLNPSRWARPAIALSAESANSDWVDRI